MIIPAATDKLNFEEVYFISFKSILNANFPIEKIKLSEITAVYSSPLNEVSCINDRPMEIVPTDDSKILTVEAILSHGRDTKSSASNMTIKDIKFINRQLSVFRHSYEKAMNTIGAQELLNTNSTVLGKRSYEN